MHWILHRSGKNIGESKSETSKGNKPECSKRKCRVEIGKFQLPEEWRHQGNQSTTQIYFIQGKIHRKHESL